MQIDKRDEKGTLIVATRENVGGAGRARVE